MKHIIWSNTNLNIEDWRNDYKDFLRINDVEVPEKINDDDIYEWMEETNDEYLYDEKVNLNKKLDGRIIVIADLGLWNGKHSGYQIVGNNLNEIFNIGGFDYAEFYGDGYNIRGTEHHHDGTNCYLFRVIREDRNIDNLLDSIYNGEQITSSKLNYYTKSLYKDVAKIYGWKQ